ncbi:hypothetical protein GOC33_05485 [Sinorhizobium meliloti]|uniref:hypothetical protein n=1 Tax=Rhizobium meliloti TaxID=382 RepID=UPI0013E3945A|nr:hypothetical protein [Sinorhizobium meliloti]MDX0105477.1 hypothetical protein [Sinorhizobium meliloti]
MVALLKDDGEFTPMPVVYDTKKFEQLAASMTEPAKPVPGLLAVIRKNREQFKNASK